MIARLRGIPAGRSADGLLIDVNGVGYLVAATPGVLRRAEDGGEITVETFLHVREDAMQLYGFVDASERELFTQLLTVSGIGPKVALAVVSGSPTAELRRAIVLEDHARFQAIPGIGKKTAERIVLELKEKVSLTADGPAAYVARGDADPSRRARRARRARLLRARGGAAPGRRRPRAAAGGARPARAAGGLEVP